MSTNTASRMGLFPQILPVTGTFIAGFGLLNTVLSLAAVRARLATSTLHGDKQSSSGEKDLGNDPVHLATRAHANFTETVPLTLLMAGIIEINGGDRQYLTYGLGTYMLLRMSHAFGFGQGVIQARAAGYYGSTALGVVMSAWSFYLSKSYWGL